MADGMPTVPAPIGTRADNDAALTSYSSKAVCSKLCKTLAMDDHTHVCCAVLRAVLCCVLCCRRARAAWKAYEEHNMPLLRMEKPNLKVSQYR